ncbi:MAG TPA: hypothetical protein VN281_10195 [Verrucomicrobiae bacterium]|nr:hypothetical protein [Verrucomicrobiae bacterium]
MHCEKQNNPGEKDDGTAGNDLPYHIGGNPFGALNSTEVDHRTGKEVKQKKLEVDQKKRVNL